MAYQDMVLPKIDFKKYLNDLSYLEAEMLKDVGDFTDGVLEMAEHGNQLIGAYFPWSKMQHTTRIGDGKLSIWAGANGSGKSQLLGQVINHTISQGRKACIASLEMQPKQTLYRMVCQSATCKASKGYSLAWLKHHTGSLYIYDQLDKVDTDRILGMAHYAAHVLGCSDIVIDSLTKCGVGRDDYTKQAEFVDRLQWCAKKWNVHIHLVAHMRKPSEGSKQDKYSIRGASEISDLADNVYIIERNFRKEEQVELMDSGREFNQEVVDQACCQLIVAKNRDYGEQKKFGLWFDRESGYYRESESIRMNPLHLEVSHEHQ